MAIQRVVVPIFPVVTPQNLDGLLQTYPVTTRQMIDALQELTRAVNNLIDIVEALP